MSPIETCDLVLLPADPALAHSVADYYARNRAFLLPFEGAHPEAFYTVSRQRALLAADVRHAAQDRGYRFLLMQRRAPGRVIGSIALTNVVRGAFHSAFVVYKLDMALQGRGYMTQALKALTAFAFGPLNLHRLEINVMPRNMASRRVAEKAGFAQEGLAKAYLRIGGVWEDHLHYVLLNSDWRS